MGHLVVNLGLALLSFATCAAAGNDYSQSSRVSQYITMRDGTRLAIDIYRPLVDAKVVKQRLPVILTATIDDRVTLRDGKPAPVDPFLDRVLARGYVIASLETRGQYASFGRASPERLESAEDYWDFYDVIEWLAAQPWSSGKVGMAGCSNRGMLQLRAAAVMPPHLDAIAPTAPPVDWATMWSVNGVTQSLFGEGLKGLSVPSPISVDGDLDGSLARNAMMEHGPWGKPLVNRPFRDAPLTLQGVHVLPTNWWNNLPNFTMTHMPVFQYAGWRDFFLEQSLALYRSLARQGVPQKIIIGPWYHCEWYESNLTDAAAETSRWYDHWLKGADNGLTKDPPIRYYVNGAPAGQEWRTANVWPLPNQKRHTYYLGIQHGLQSSKPTTNSSNDSYVVNYNGSTRDLAMRFNVKAFTAKSEEFDAKNIGLLTIPTSSLDANSLNYTSAPLSHDSELTGFPVITLWISSTAKDQDFMVYLEEVGADGRSTLLTEGVMRASNRATREPPFDNEGMPWHPSYQTDQRDLEPGVPTKLEWALFPFSNYVRAGHRLRVTINSFDKDGWMSPEISPAPTVRIYHDSQQPSSITVPFVTR